MSGRDEQQQPRDGWLEVADRLRREPSRVVDVSSLAEHLGVSGQALARLIRRHFHATPPQLLVRWRLEAACRRLLETDRPVASIAENVGFADTSSLRDEFRRRLLSSPEDFRSLLGADRLRLELPPWWRQQSVVEYWRRDPSSRHEKASSDRILWALASPAGPLGIELRLPAPGGGRRIAEARLSGSCAEHPHLAAWAHLTVVRLLGLHLDPGAFEDRTLGGAHGRLVAGRRGLVIPQTATLIDGIAWVICGQQVSLAVAFKLRRALAERFGRPVGELLAPPTASDLAGAQEGELFALGFSRRKEEYLRGIARQMIGEPRLDLEAMRHGSAVELEKRLLEVRGFGPWSVNYLMMRSFGLADCVPVGDAALVRALKVFFALDERPGADATRQLMEVFAPHRSLATFHLWATLKDLPRREG